VDAQTALQLTDWRRQVGELYARVRTLGASIDTWQVWRDGKQRLYRNHPQSPVPQSERSGYVFACFDHDPSMRVAAALVPSPPQHQDGDGEVPGHTHVGTLHFALAGVDCQLGAYWLDGYAGGLFVPFADATSGHETYGGGRYALDTAKGADLGSDGDAIVLDFNFAYAPSCAHDPRWRCPLALPANRLAVPVRAGEIAF
jgi:uncharacterized protein (DUF1684 family)